MSKINRRRFLNRTLAGGASAILSPSVFAAGPPAGLVDTNIDLFRWPFRRLPLDDTGALVAKLRTLGITRAWAGSYEGIFHRDLGEANRRLGNACREHPDLLLPFGSVSPALPGWQAELRRCAGEHRMPGIRLHPNYHGYTLDDPRFAELLGQAAESNLLVQLAVSMEDPRTQHPAVQVPDVDLAPLPAILEKFPAATIQVLNFKPGAPVLDKFNDIPNVVFDMARVEDTHGVKRMIDTLGPGRVLFGTHAPFFIPESAFIKVHESDLSKEAHRALFSDNATALLGPRSATNSQFSILHSQFPSGLPPRQQLNSYETWDSYFTAFDSGPDSSRILAAIERTLPTIEKARIKKLCLFPHVGIGTADTATETRLAADPASILAPFERWPGKLIGMIHLNPNNVRASLDALDRWIRDGPFLGVYFPGSGPGALTCTHKNFDPLVARIHEHGGQIMQHNWFITGGKARPGMSTPSELATLAARYPEQPFICAHAGGEWQKGIRAIRDSPNVLIETSGFDPTAGFIEMAVRELGAERIIFGSHLPSRSLGTELGKVLGADITDADRRKILSTNYRTLLAPLLKKKGIS